MTPRRARGHRRPRRDRDAQASSGAVTAATPSATMQATSTQTPRPGSRTPRTDARRGPGRQGREGRAPVTRRRPARAAPRRADAQRGEQGSGERDDERRPAQVVDQHALGREHGKDAGAPDDRREVAQIAPRARRARRDRRRRARTRAEAIATRRSSSPSASQGCTWTSRTTAEVATTSDAAGEPEPPLVERGGERPEREAGDGDHDRARDRVPDEEPLGGDRNGTRAPRAPSRRCGSLPRKTAAESAP